MVQTSWKNWPLGVVSGKYDAAITNVTVTKERKTRFRLCHLPHRFARLYVKTGGKIATIKQPADIAGLKIIVGSSTNQEAILLAGQTEPAAGAQNPSSRST